MKNYALLNNNIVINVSVANDDWDSTGWIEYTDSRPAIIGHTYDQSRNAFIAPKCHDEATLNESTYHWNCNNIIHNPSEA